MTAQSAFTPFSPQPGEAAFSARLSRVVVGSGFEQFAR
jgi:hypothetical protein